MKTEKFLKENANQDLSSEPTIFDLSKRSGEEDLQGLIDQNGVQVVVDDYEEQQRELFGVNNPSKVYAPNFETDFQDYLRGLGESMPLWRQGHWVYYPWSSTLVHILLEDDFWLVRTARNKNLITAEEQDKFYNSTVGIGGMSIGSSVAFALALQGGAKHIKLADMDRLALSNTNRILMGVDNLGALKVEMAARRIYEINPYAEVELFSDGLQPDNIGKFFEGLDIVIDELDNLAVKYLIREHAKKHKIAVVMAADNGDNSVVDIERYDLDPDTPFFHGRMGEVDYEMLSKLDKFGIGKMITKHVGPENVTERMQQSLLEMGKTIVSWPQLGGAAMINGAAVAYCVRKILNGQELESNRALILLDKELTPDWDTPESAAKRGQVVESFKKIFGL
ncbi:MAG: ThiF family adenylyltransferase [Patescibacteria group bacterium]|nr:ThiF family adenylyltransferase [Patescibacteria group bacterium]